MKNKYDDLMIQGLITLKNLEFAYVSDIENIDYVFSEKYIRHKEKLIKNLGRPYWKYVNTIAKKAAVIIVSLIIAFSSLMTVDAIREKFVSFVYKIYNTFTQISYNDTVDSNSIKTNYTFTNVPITYDKHSTTLTESANSYYWIDKMDRFILLKQASKTETTQFNSEHGELFEKIINDTPCLICKDPNLYYCYWEFDGYRFELIYPLDLGEEFMSEVVGNLVEIDPDKLNN